MTKGSRQHTANPHWGTPLDSFLDEDGIREAAKAEAATRGTRSFSDLVQSRAARAPEFAAALLHEDVEASGKRQDDE